ncbi:MAG: glutamine amidotransferase [Propionibacteriales bacterium]|nr:glutamine amidotransferase [Propionibacteriales bacterium]
MCGIVGLHLKTPRLHDRLGELLSTMLEAMTTRGPDSAGIAVFDDTARPTMRLFKDVGSPREICERYGVPRLSGHQGVGHTRMATESAVSTEHSHPFAPSDDLALVHNGTFSNYATVRRALLREGVEFATDNDSEVAARYIAQQRAGGADLDEALRMVLKTFDGFYTLVVVTEEQFAVVRDSFACKPMVIAETEDYAAVGSEYHALAGLPGIADAEVYEPGPEEVYTWSR